MIREWESGPGGRLTRSEHEPPEQYLSEGACWVSRSSANQAGGSRGGWKDVLHDDPEV